MLLVEQVMPTQFVSSRRGRTVASWLVYTGSSGKCLAALFKQYSYLIALICFTYTLHLLMSLPESEER